MQTLCFWSEVPFDLKPSGISFRGCSFGGSLCHLSFPSPRPILTPVTNGKSSLSIHLAYRQSASSVKLKHDFSWLIMCIATDVWKEVGWLLSVVYNLPCYVERKVFLWSCGQPIQLMVHQTRMEDFDVFCVLQIQINFNTCRFSPLIMFCSYIELWHKVEQCKAYCDRHQDCHTSAMQNMPST